MSECDQKWASTIESFDYIHPYLDPLKQWVSSLKYSRNFIAGRILQNITTMWLYENRSRLNGIDYIVPVPIVSRRLHLRGFNQTVYLLNQQKVLKRDSSCVTKTKFTAQQAGLDREARTGIQKGTFTVKKDVTDKVIMLFDDVCTTGQTLAEISHVLKQKGAREIRILVLCRSHG